ncbi:hypothetical protein D5086_028000 [Populus alba]|uniref:Uncharacterized protein n=1 Tax=Populus alba TaxID=43335 RepID=A0ACC4AXH4_POPAL
MCNVVVSETSLLTAAPMGLSSPLSAPKSLRITNGSKFDCLELREQVMYEYCAPGGDGDLLRPSPVHQLEPHSSAVDVMISHALQASIFC